MVRQWKSIPSMHFLLIIYSSYFLDQKMPRYSFKNLYLFIDALFDNENRLFFPPARSLFVYSSYFFDQRIDIKNTRLFIDTLSENELFLPSFLYRKNWSYIRFSGDDWRQIDINIPLFTRSFLEKQKYTSFSWSTSNFVFRSLRMRTWQGPQGAIDTEVGFTYIPLHVATTA